MENGYKILWTNHALKELSETYDYLETNFTEREMKKLSLEIDKTLKLISINPRLFPLSEFKGVRKIAIKNSTQCIIEKMKIQLKFYLSSLTDKTLIKEYYKNAI